MVNMYYKFGYYIYIQWDKYLLIYKTNYICLITVSNNRLAPEREPRMEKQLGDTNWNTEK